MRATYYYQGRKLVMWLFAPCLHHVFFTLINCLVASFYLLRQHLQHHSWELITVKSIQELIIYPVMRWNLNLSKQQSAHVSSFLHKFSAYSFSFKVRRNEWQGTILVVILQNLQDIHSFDINHFPFIVCISFAAVDMTVDSSTLAIDLSRWMLSC